MHTCIKYMVPLNFRDLGRNGSLSECTTVANVLLLLLILTTLVTWVLPSQNEGGQKCPPYLIDTLPLNWMAIQTKVHKNP